MGILDGLVCVIQKGLTIVQPCSQLTVLQAEGFNFRAEGCKLGAEGFNFVPLVAELGILDEIAKGHNAEHKNRNVKHCGVIISSGFLLDGRSSGKAAGNG